MNRNFYTSLSDKVYRRLLGDIVSGKIPAGEKVGEEAAAAKLKVSRTPVREAIHRLTAEGLIERIPRCGCRVKKTNSDYIRNIFECRMLLECHALESGFDNIPEMKLNEMRELLNNIDKLTGWSEDVKIMQKNWIGKSYGVDIFFNLEKSSLLE